MPWSALIYVYFCIHVNILHSSWHKPDTCAVCRCFCCKIFNISPKWTLKTRLKSPNSLGFSEAQTCIKTMTVMFWSYRMDKGSHTSFQLKCFHFKELLKAVLSAHIGGFPPKFLLLQFWKVYCVLHQDELQGLFHGVQTALQDPRSPQQPQRVTCLHPIMLEKTALTAVCEVRMQSFPLAVQLKWMKHPLMKKLRSHVRQDSHFSSIASNLFIVRYLFSQLCGQIRLFKLAPLLKRAQASYQMPNVNLINMPRVYDRNTWGASLSGLVHSETLCAGDSLNSLWHSCTFLIEKHKKRFKPLSRSPVKPRENQSIFSFLLCWASSVAVKLSLYEPWNQIQPTKQVLALS